MGVQKEEKGGVATLAFGERKSTMPSSIAFFWVWGGQKGKNISGALVRVLESASRAVKLNQPRVLPFFCSEARGDSRES